MSNYRAEGHAAYEAGTAITDCPYIDTNEYPASAIEAWMNGWREAESSDPSDAYLSAGATGVEHGDGTDPTLEFDEGLFDAGYASWLCGSEGDQTESAAYRAGQRAAQRELGKNTGDWFNV